MYVRLITYHFKPDVTSADASMIYREMLDQMRDISGFMGLSLLINEDVRQAVSLSYWRDQESASEAGIAILPHLMDRANEFVDRPPEVSGFELVSQEMTAS